MPNKKRNRAINRKQKAKQEKKLPSVAENAQFVFPIQELISLIGNNEQIGFLFSKIANISFGIINPLQKEWSIKKHEIPDRLHKILYLALADMNSFTSIGTENIQEDKYLQEMLLHRLTHVVNLELLYHSKMNEINEIQDDESQMLLELIHNYSHTSDFSHNYQDIKCLSDYLPENKFRVLLIHPADLWGNKKYDQYKENTREEFIKEKLYSINPFLEKGSRYVDQLTSHILNLRNDMIVSYELLAETDQELLDYCVKKKYAKKDLFAMNKSTILTALNTCDHYNSNHLHPMQEKTELSIKLYKQILDKSRQWLNLSEEGPDWDLQYNTNKQDHLNLFLNTDSFLDICFSIFMNLNVEEVNHLFFYIFDEKNTAAIIQGIEVLVSAAGIDVNEVLSSMKSLKSFMSTVHQTLTEFRDMQKQKPVKVKLFILQLIEEFNSTLQKNPNSSFLLNFFREKIGLVSNILDGTVSPERVLILCCQEANFKVAKPFLDKLIDVFPPLMTALQYHKGSFANQILEYLAKHRNKLVRWVPETLMKQSKLLNSILQFSKIDEQSSKALLLKLLNRKNKWDTKTIQKLIDEIDNASLKSLLEHYLQEQSLKKISHSKKSFFDRNVIKLSVMNAVEEKKDAEEYRRPVDDAFSLNDNPVKKLRAFYAEPFSPENESVHCNALALVFLQYAQAYLNTGQDHYLDSLTLMQARCFRNALVHQFQQDVNSYSLLLDGEGKNILTLAKVLLEAIEQEDAQELLADKLFCKALAHGRSLQAQMNRGECEHVQFRQRLIFTRWLNASYFSLENKVQEKTIKPEVLEHAKAMLAILRQLYCLRQGGCSGEEVDHALARSIRHLPDALPPKLQHKQQPLLRSGT